MPSPRGPGTGHSLMHNPQVLRLVVLVSVGVLVQVRLCVAFWTVPAPRASTAASRPSAGTWAPISWIGTWLLQTLTGSWLPVTFRMLSLLNPVLPLGSLHEEPPLEPPLESPHLLQLSPPLPPPLSDPIGAVLVLLVLVSVGVLVQPSVLLVVVW